MANEKRAGAPPIQGGRLIGVQIDTMRGFRTILTYVALVLIALTTVVPLVWMVFTSLHPPRAQVPTMSNLFTPVSWHPENYWTVLTYGELPVWKFAVNSFVVTAGVVVFQLILCSLAAFGFSRLSWRGRDTLFFVFLLTMMIPAQVLIVPLFMLVHDLGWLDTYWGLIIPYPYLSTAFGTFLLPLSEISNYQRRLVSPHGRKTYVNTT